MNEEQWESLKRRFLWLRGALFAFAVLGLVPQVFDLNQDEVLRAARALIHSWNDIPAWLVQLLGFLPFFPTFDREDASLIGNFVLLIAIIRIGGHAEDKFSRRVPSNRSEKAIAFILVWSKFTIFAYFAAALTVVAIMQFLGYDPRDLETIFLTIQGRWWSYLLYPFAIIPLLAGFGMLFYVLLTPVLILIELKTFRNGLIFAVSCIVTIELIYYARLPVVSEYINTQSCKALDIQPDQCQRSN